MCVLCVCINITLTATRIKTMCVWPVEEEPSISFLTLREKIRQQGDDDLHLSTKGGQPSAGHSTLVVHTYNIEKE